MKKLNEINNNGLNFWDYARNYTAGIVSGLGSLYCFGYSFIKGDLNMALVGFGAGFIATLRFLNGHTNLRKLKRIYGENIQLKKQLEEIVEE